MITRILADSTTSILELKKDPMAVVEGADGFPMAITSLYSIVYQSQPMKHSWIH